MALIFWFLSSDQRWMTTGTKTRQCHLWPRKAWCSSLYLSSTRSTLISTLRGSRSMPPASSASRTQWLILSPFERCLLGLADSVCQEGQNLMPIANPRSKAQEVMKELRVSTPKWLFPFLTQATALDASLSPLCGHSYQTRTKRRGATLSILFGCVTHTKAEYQCQLTDRFR